MLTAKQDNLFTALVALHTTFVLDVKDSDLFTRAQKSEAIKRLDASASLLWEIFEILGVSNKEENDE